MGSPEGRESQNWSARSSASAKSGVGWYFAPDRIGGALRGAVAQLGERLTGSQKAGGSSPPSSTKLDKIENLRVDVLSGSLSGLPRMQSAGAEPRATEILVSLPVAAVGEPTTMSALSSMDSMSLPRVAAADLFA